MSQQLDRARRFLSTRYGVDASTLGETEVIRRASAILGVRRADSAAQTLAAIDLRLDGEWSEEDHPRAEDGKFSGDGGGGGGRTSKVETGSSGDHAARATAAAQQARAVASGTTPSARASARKAEESAALARAAHAQGNHGEAARHAAAAAKHAADVDRKVAAHVPASERGLDEKQMRQEGGVAAKRDSEKLSNLVAQAAKVAKEATATGTPAQASKAHQLASSAHNLAASQARAMGNHDLAKVLSQKAADHMARAAEHDRARYNPPTDKYAAGKAATAEAKKLSDAARVKPTAESHAAAAEAHRRAAATPQSGSTQAGWHLGKAEEHERAASALKPEKTPKAATDKAYAASEGAYTKERHLEAEKLHRTAAELQSRAGNEGAARAHEEAADSHKIAASLDGRRATSADRSGSADRVAKEFSAAAKHLSDNPQTDRKSDASGNLVHHSSVDDYEHSGDTEHHAEQLKSIGARIVDTRDQYFSEDHGRGDVFYKLPKGVSNSQFRQVESAKYDVNSGWGERSREAQAHLDKAVVAVHTGRGEDAVKHAAEASRLGRAHAEAMRRR